MRSPPTGRVQQRLAWRCAAREEEDSEPPPADPRWERRSATGRSLSRRARRRRPAQASARRRRSWPEGVAPKSVEDAGNQPATVDRRRLPARSRATLRAFLPSPFRAHGRTPIVAGTFDTKGRELKFIRDRLKALGVPTRTVDLSTSGKLSTADVTPLQVASMHPGGTSTVFSADRGQAVTAMAEAFARWMAREPRGGSIIWASGLRRHNIGNRGYASACRSVFPKLWFQRSRPATFGPMSGATDVVMFDSVADVQGLNSIMELGTQQCRACARRYDCADAHTRGLRG